MLTDANVHAAQMRLVAMGEGDAARCSDGYEGIRAAADVLSSVDDATLRVHGRSLDQAGQLLRDACRAGDRQSARLIYANWEELYERLDIRIEELIIEAGG